jgi:hypothetical protein
MQSAKDRKGDNVTDPRHGSPQWRILLQSQVRTRLIVIAHIGRKSTPQVRLAGRSPFLSENHIRTY